MNEANPMFFLYLLHIDSVSFYSFVIASVSWIILSPWWMWTVNWAKKYDAYQYYLKIMY